MSLHFCTFHFEAVSLKRLNIYIYGFSGFVKEFFRSNANLPEVHKTLCSSGISKAISGCAGTRSRLSSGTDTASRTAEGQASGPEPDQAPGRNRISGNQGPQWDQAPGSARRLHPAQDLPLPPYYISADPQRNRTYPFRHRQSAAYNFWSHILPSEE